MKKIFIIGGAGYVGTELTDLLLKSGYYCTVYDLMIYGEEFLPYHKNLNIIKGDLRDLKKIKKNIKNHEIVIHLACISNDPSFELDPKLGKEINYDPFLPLLKICNENQIERFIYASSSSVYGIKEKLNVNEDENLQPLTDYSKYKAECEDLLLNFKSEKFTKTVLRPATVCGYSKRQRLDVVVNILSNLAYNKKPITVFGGEQLRPNIHIKDMIRVYKKIIESKKDLISNQIFNVGYENLKVLDIAKKVKKIFGEEIEIKVVPTNDNRSYHINSDKIKKKLNFEPKFTVEDAIRDLKDAFENNRLRDSLTNEKYFNIKMMQKIKLQ